MIFKGEPFLCVIDTQRGRQIGRFDENGLFECNDEQYIYRLKSKFQVVEKPENPQEPEKPKSNKRVCKKCGKEFDGQGALLTHYRNDHKDGD